jgi:Rrf2 family cysteine metabolism transcriptional repressor
VYFRGDGHGGQTSVVLSQKSQYAVRAVFELSKRHGSRPVKASSIAEAQCIPIRFLENILGQLRQAGIVDSARGKEGGYRLNRPPQQLSVGEVIRLVQGPLSAVECVSTGTGNGAGGGRECALKSGCVLLPMWEKAHGAMMGVYDGTTFHDLAEQERATHASEVIDFAI